MMSTMGGEIETVCTGTADPCDDTCRASVGCDEPTSVDEDYLKVVLWDLRLKSQVLQWPLQDCGDGVVNATAFEECDYAASPNPT